MKQSLIILIFIVLSINVFSQYTIKGFVQDAQSGERLPFATVYNKNTQQGTITNNYGFFSLNSNTDSINLSVSYVSYIPTVINISTSTDTIIKINLYQDNNIEEVVVSGLKNENTDNQHSRFNVINLPIKELSKIPVIFGESDVMKTLQLMPGICGGEEGTSGLYVRGGSPDQNLVLLDGVPVYNANHLFGFFSVFNQEALQNVTVMKGGFPARYGGRLSSVVDIQMKEGNNKKFKGEASIGLISSKVSLEGPIKNDKTSFIVSARRTYVDMLLWLALIGTSEEGEELSCGYYFYDFNAKINHKISDKNQIFISFYTGKDKAYMDDKISNYSMIEKTKFDLKWKNTTFALRYNSVLTSKLFLNTTLTYSKYLFGYGNSIENNTVEPGVSKPTSKQSSGTYSNSGIYDYGAKCDFDYYPHSAHLVKFGIGYVYHSFEPEINYFEQSSDTQQSTITDTTYGNHIVHSHEVYAYIEDNWDICPVLKANAGVRLTNFRVQQKNYSAIEPRLSLQFRISNKHSVKAAYSRMQQYIHLLSNSSVGLPTDLWLPSTQKIKPMYSDEYSFGFQYDMKPFQFIAETYYKEMYNILEYSEESAYLVNSSNWEEKVEAGKGNSYGIELSVRKNYGKLTGWVGYTLSQTNREFENINQGKAFPYKYDRRHNISFVLTYKFSEKMDIGLTWVYNTGSAITLPIQKYSSLDPSDDMNYYYSERNAYRMPAYHRMDIGANFYKQKKHRMRVWSVSIYNVYNHKNTYYVYVKDTGSATELRQYTILPIIPSISYKFKF